MDSATWRRVRELFEQLEEIPPGERETWLDLECAGEPDVRHELERLRRAEGVPSEWLSPPGDVGWLTPGPEKIWQPGEQFGPYRLRSKIGSGGMGAVYCAEQETPRRLVALKTLRADRTSEDLLRRFRTEVEILGQLRHPGIAQIYDAGTREDGDSSVPYLVMEYVEDALGLVAYADREGLGERQRLELFVSVCEAVHHGHQKGVIHRDLKPGNVLVDAEGRPKVIDFGLARPLDPESFEFSFVQTRVGEIMGTLAYMSPEHVSGDTFAIDTRSDVYSLGCILCELLTGTPPHELSELPLPSVVRRIAEEEPSLTGRVSGDLRWILEKALAREPERRYGSASELAADIRRSLDADPIVAGPPSAFYRLTRMARRHRALIFSVAAVIVALSVGLLQARDEADNARRQADVSRIVSVFLTDLFDGTTSYRKGKEARVIDVIEMAERKLSTIEDPIVRAILQGIVGKGFMTLDDHERGAPLVAEAAESLRDLVEPEDLHRLRTEVIYADLLEVQQRIEESLQLSEEILPRLERVLGPAHDQTRYLRYNLAVCCQRLGDFARAEELFLTNLEIVATDGDGPHSVSYMNLLHRVATTRHDLGRLEEAQEDLLQALELARTLDGVSPLYEATFLMDLANTRQKMGDGVIALATFREVDRLYGELRPTVSNRFALAQNLGWSLLENGELDEAAEQQEKGRTLLDDHWKREPGFRHAESLRLQAAVASARGDHEDADTAARSALELVEDMLAGGALWPVYCYETLLDVLLAGDHSEDAYDTARLAYERVSEALGPEHRLSLEILTRFTRAAVAAGHRQDAIRLAGDLLARAADDDSLTDEARRLLEEAESLADGDADD